MNVIGKTHKGLVRRENQDRVRTTMLCDNVALAVLCDGMGGENAGSEASEVAVNTIFERIENGFRADFDSNNIRNLMLSAVNAANALIFNISSEDSNKLGMGTTCVMAIATEKLIHIVNIGDSRAYLITNSGISQLTFDHTIVNMLLRNGEIEEFEAKDHPQKNIITKAVGVTPELEPDYFEQECVSGYKILLCSDGLSSYCDENDVFEIVLNNDIAASSDALINLANDNGGRDNITVAIIEE